MIEEVMNAVQVLQDWVEAGIEAAREENSEFNFEDCKEMQLFLYMLNQIEKAGLEHLKSNTH